MKKIIFILFIFFTTITYSNSNPSLDIGEKAKILDFNWVCSNNVDITFQKWIGLKVLKSEGLITQSDFRLDEGIYPIPTTILLKRRQKESGVAHYVYYRPLLSKNIIEKNTLITKTQSNETTLYTEIIIFNHSLDNEIDKLKAIEDKMWKERNNTKFIRLVEKFTKSIDELVLTEKGKNEATYKFNCKTSEFILKAAEKEG
ncbi:hypothetical protein N9W58_02275 [Candidatus Pelagibacter bacterium]|jgi:hypothetical protein|nr:hypothetical protein [Candidatus Pelagibacter bacterium]|tara:strand:- start:379 stop:981 length:603 start_codon:yes stop_codon:yes gene_type:complete